LVSRLGLRTMEQKTHFTSRLIASILGILLVWQSVQTLGFAPNIEASASPRLLAIPGEITSATENTVDINTWDYTITQPGVYRLSQDLIGTKGPAITVDTDDVTILGNGYTIKGDGLTGETLLVSASGIIENEEVGIIVNPGVKRLNVFDMNYQDMDKGFWGENYSDVSAVKNG
jgi:hypothetical protein